MNQEKPYLEIGILDLLQAIVKRKRQFLLISGFFLLLAFALAFLTPQYWVSKVTFVPIVEKENNLPLDLSLLSFLNETALSSERNQLAFDFVTVLDSRTVREELVKRFDLVRYFKITRSDSLEASDLAMQKLADKILRIHLDPETSVIIVSIETKDKALSRNIAAASLAILENYNKNKRLSKSKLTRIFLENRLSEIKAKLDSLNLAEKNFKQKNQSIEIDLQTQSTISLYSETVTQKFQNEIELELAKATLDSNSPQVADLIKKQALLNAKIKDIESHNSSLFPKYMLQMDKLPDIKMQSARMQLNKSMLEQIYTTFYPQYELARMQEIKDMPTLEVIDSPNLAGLRAKPKRTLLIVMITLAGLVMASMLCILSEFTGSQQKEQFSQILKDIRLKK